MGYAPGTARVVAEDLGTGFRFGRGGGLNLFIDGEVGVVGLAAG